MCNHRKHRIHKNYQPLQWWIIDKVEDSTFGLDNLKLLNLKIMHDSREAIHRIEEIENGEKKHYKFQKFFETNHTVKQLKVKIKLISEFKQVQQQGR